RQLHQLGKLWGSEQEVICTEPLAFFLELCNPLLSLFRNLEPGFCASRSIADGIALQGETKELRWLVSENANVERWICRKWEVRFHVADPEGTTLFYEGSHVPCAMQIGCAGHDVVIRAPPDTAVEGVDRRVQIDQNDVDIVAKFSSNGTNHKYRRSW